MGYYKGGGDFVGGDKFVRKFRLCLRGGGRRWGACPGASRPARPGEPRESGGRSYALVGPAGVLLGWEDGAPPEPQCRFTPPTACGTACAGACLCMCPILPPQ